MHTICCPRPPSDGFEESVDLKRFANSIAELSNLLCSAFTSHLSASLSNSVNIQVESKF
ncbi:hypothetical protein HanRHA438_Chr13g0605511 [Helianthus annuus]|uniref:Uncharacterized protein n=1 Tax=Helianthus annuus TaxID=4232 RepID=A0A251ST74_HELAN|nr:hypothetical protein HanIR_Chr17g0897171 [Helianthus annuus]KAJ0481835.1 hypothetical protein HanIR_Chr13g0647171 [Helianthus annuus]KAJ0671693.1 hypothetical protein HanOQP8_Chr13g0488521 [Helianthus annuus]KAJ0858822.1 hypothetical protein HanRHA438_Chr13g0605511 [Helianthus annuus]